MYIPHILTAPHTVGGLIPELTCIGNDTIDLYNTENYVFNTNGAF